MCRNIRVLHHFKPPTTTSEIHAAALQYVRKVAGITSSKPRAEEQALLDKSAAVVAAETKRLLKLLPKHGEARTREGEKQKAHARWHKRELQLAREFEQRARSTRRARAPRSGSAAPHRHSH